jgi:hypothetical protein
MRIDQIGVTEVWKTDTKKALAETGGALGYIVHEPLVQMVVDSIPASRSRIVRACCWRHPGIVIWQ